MKLEVKLLVSTRDVATLDSKYFVLAVGNVSRVSALLLQKSRKRLSVVKRVCFEFYCSVLVRTTTTG